MKLTNLYGGAKRKLPPTISEGEAIKMIKTAKKRNHKLAILLGFYQAMRVGEVVKLRKDDVDMERGFIHIKQAKGESDRDIPIVPEVKFALRFLPVKVGVRALQKAVNRISKKALGRRIHFHMLRHSGATFYLNERKKDIRHIQRFLGHARIETTQIYTHVTPEDLKREFGG